MPAIRREKFSLHFIALVGVGLVAATASAVVVMIGPEKPVPDPRFIELQCGAISQIRKVTRDPNELARVRAAIETLTRLCARKPATAATADNWVRAFAKELGAIEPYISDDSGPWRITEPLSAAYRTYTILLVPSSDWAGKQKTADLESLREKFRAFGDAIGASEAAIWLSLPHTAHVDVLRAKYYCDRWGLNYNDGPYIVTMSRRPDIVTATDEKVVVKLGGISPGRITAVLNVLESDLRRGAKPRQGVVLYEEVKQYLLSAFERNESALIDVGVSLIK